MVTAVAAERMPMESRSDTARTFWTSRPGPVPPEVLRVTKAQQEAFTGQRRKDSNVTEGRFLLGLIIDKDLGVVDCFSKGPMLVAKLR